MPIVVVFEGGMGAQIVQSAVYFSMKATGHIVYADMSYFDSPKNLALVGNSGEIIYRPWQLEPFGLFTDSFDVSPGLTSKNADIIKDGERMLAIALNALAQPEIQRNFAILDDLSDVLAGNIPESFLCMHLRRGDYVNVASHLLVADDEFLGLIRKFSRLVENVVVISDSPIESDFRKTISPNFKKVFFLDNIDAFTSHRIMRKAMVLICSNSTFSLTAAALNSDALAIIPKHWFEGKISYIEAPIHSRCFFQIIKNNIDL
ncbi:alpha-1,2-fucosyltransferase [Geobacter pelophilus]|uniref:Alpha-1,2-fucosyltransferase n=1 Tax=Geoanaerobacter pelophilus TaxID=60036 RepID=A0AAW4LC07_9BACT|nr:alpha-1,2-fucosyltransferase [Geoanaerobacter pelophilus]MBT0665559.1 alpha-1,2-fucosyltransferase [Geoanaerobacter pelophilus]